MKSNIIHTLFLLAVYTFALYRETTGDVSDGIFWLLTILVLIKFIDYDKR